MAEDAAIAAVKALWRTFERGGVGGVIEATDPDAEWMPFSGGGRVLRGHGALRAFARSLRDEGAELRAHADSFERVGDCVVVTGRLRVQSWTSVSDQELVWVFRVAGGRVRRAAAFRTREEALAACEAERSGAARPT